MMDAQGVIGKMKAWIVRNAKDVGVLFLASIHQKVKTILDAKGVIMNIKKMQYVNHACIMLKTSMSQESRRNKL